MTASEKSLLLWCKKRRLLDTKLIAAYRQQIDLADSIEESQWAFSRCVRAIGRVDAWNILIRYLRGIQK